MKLFELQRDEGVKIFGLEPNGDKNGVVIFGHIDGMYSYCWIEGHEDKVIHLNAGTPLVKVDGGYKVNDEEID